MTRVFSNKFELYLGGENLGDFKRETLSDIEGFNLDGYQFSKEHTQNELQPVFIR